MFQEAEMLPIWGEIDSPPRQNQLPADRPSGPRPHAQTPTASPQARDPRRALAGSPRGGADGRLQRLARVLPRGPPRGVGLRRGEGMRRCARRGRRGPEQRDAMPRAAARARLHVHGDCDPAARRRTALRARAGLPQLSTQRVLELARRRERGSVESRATRVPLRFDATAARSRVDRRARRGRAHLGVADRLTRAGHRAGKSRRAAGRRATSTSAAKRATGRHRRRGARRSTSSRAGRRKRQRDVPAGARDAAETARGARALATMSA